MNFFFQTLVEADLVKGGCGLGSLAASPGPLCCAAPCCAVLPRPLSAPKEPCAGTRGPACAPGVHCSLTSRCIGLRCAALCCTLSAHAPCQIPLPSSYCDLEGGCSYTLGPRIQKLEAGQCKRPGSGQPALPRACKPCAAACERIVALPSKGACRLCTCLCTWPNCWPTASQAYGEPGRRAAAPPCWSNSNQSILCACSSPPRPTTLAHTHTHSAPIKHITSNTPSLPAGQLLFSETVGPPFWFPPAVITRGPDVPFIGGAPLALAAPPVPGYDVLPGTNQFAFTGGSFNCSFTEL